MPKISVLDASGNQVGEMELSDSVFGIKPNVYVMHEVVVNHLANLRQGTQSALTRSEVSGGGKKPWRQKGTGHARQGSTRAPQWRHGGIVFAPKPREYGYHINKKVRRLALKSALSSKYLEGDIIVLDSIKLEEYKTKAIVKMLDAVGAKGKSLIVMDGRDDKVIRSAGNVPKVYTAQADNVNVYDILNSKKLILVRDAVTKIEEAYA